MDTIIQKITAVAHTLDLVSVCGKQNMMRLSGCIDVLESVLQELQQSAGACEKEVK